MARQQGIMGRIHHFNLGFYLLGYMTLYYNGLVNKKKLINTNKKLRGFLHGKLRLFSSHATQTNSHKILGFVQIFHVLTIPSNSTFLFSNYSYFSITLFCFFFFFVYKKNILRMIVMQRNVVHETDVHGCIFCFKLFSYSILKYSHVGVFFMSRSRWL